MDDPFGAMTAVNVVAVLKSPASVTLPVITTASARVRCALDCRHTRNSGSSSWSFSSDASLSFVLHLLFWAFTVPGAVQSLGRTFAVH
jgi:hypothetical protein